MNMQHQRLQHKQQQSDYAPAYDQFLQRKKIFQIETKLNQNDAIYYEGIQLNKKQLHNQAIKESKESIEYPDDLEIYISRHSVKHKAEEIKPHPDFYYNL